MKIEAYSGKYDDEIIALVLSIQNEEAKIDLSLVEQPDLTDIARFYQKDGGNFWIALADGKSDRHSGTHDERKRLCRAQKVFRPKGIPLTEGRSCSVYTAADLCRGKGRKARDTGHAVGGACVPPFL